MYETTVASIPCNSAYIMSQHMLQILILAWLCHLLSELEEMLRDLSSVKPPREGGREGSLLTERSRVRSVAFNDSTTSGTC